MNLEPQPKDYDAIDKIIQWYQSLPAAHEQLEGLMKARRQLSCIAVKLAAEQGVALKAYNQVYGQRKIKFHKLREQYREELGSVAAAESRAESEIEAIRSKEANLEGAKDSGKVLLANIHQVLNAMAGEINFLREEKTSVNNRE